MSQKNYRCQSNNTDNSRLGFTLTKGRTGTKYLLPNELTNTLKMEFKNSDISQMPHNRSTHNAGPSVPNKTLRKCQNNSWDTKPNLSVSTLPQRRVHTPGPPPRPIQKTTMWESRKLYFQDSKKTNLMLDETTDSMPKNVINNMPRNHSKNTSRNHCNNTPMNNTKNIPLNITYNKSDKVTNDHNVKMQVNLPNNSSFCSKSANTGIMARKHLSSKFNERHFELASANTIPIIRYDNKTRDGCICNRPQATVCCRMCGFQIRGNVKVTCPRHPLHHFLYELERCPDCSAVGALMEEKD